MLKMDMPKSKLIPLLCVIYGLFAIAGFYVAALGHFSRPDPLPLIDETVGKPEQLEQAKRILAQAKKQEPTHVILSMFYRWDWLKYEYESLSTYQKPAYDGDSFEERLNSYNRDVKRISATYAEAVTALSLLSAGGLILTIIMLWVPGYLVSLLLGSFPVWVVFTCILFDINYDILDYCWIPFIVLGGIIFLLQLIYSFRFGLPEHHTAEGIQGLMIYRRGLLMFNLGAFLLIGALLMAGGHLSGTGHASRVRLGLALLGEGGIVIIGLIAGIIMAIPGLYYLTRKPSDKVI
jgi:hypothetical protein